jgi:alpha-tubulin suppressor-like RCC1 family protein
LYTGQVRYLAPTLLVALALAAAFVSARSTLAAPGPAAANITADADHTCAVTAGGAAKCWGDNGSGKLGDGTTQPRAVPVSVSGISGVSAIAGGLFHTCAITTAGALYCWGSNAYGQLGDGTTADHTTPAAVPGLGSVTDIGTGYSHSCAVVSGGVKCWGDNTFGQLGNGSTTDHTSPIDVFGLTSGVVAVAAGQYFNCALTTGGGVKCWGDNVYGQLGDGSTMQRIQPVDVTGLSSGVMAIAASEGGHTCALLDTGAVKCWGNNEYGQLGENRACPTPCTSPVDVTGLSSGVSEITVGYFSTCALLSGSMKCWGNNQFGQVGDNQVCGVLCGTPVDVSGLPAGVTTITAGARHTCARTASAIYCWGDNFEGQVGDNGECGTACLVPVAVTGAADFPVGDANCDRATNSIDSAVVLQFGAGLISSLACAAQADVNGDHNVNSIDSALILQYEAGLIPTLPPP